MTNIACGLAVMLLIIAIFLAIIHTGYVLHMANWDALAYAAHIALIAILIVIVLALDEHAH